MRRGRPDASAQDRGDPGASAQRLPYRRGTDPAGRRHQLQQFLRIRHRQDRPFEGRQDLEAVAVVGEGQRRVRKAGQPVTGRIAQGHPCRRTHLPAALRGRLVDGDSVDRRTAGRGAQALCADLQGQVRGVHHVGRPAADARRALPLDQLAVSRRPAHRRSDAPADPAGHRPVRQAAAAAERRAVAAGGAVEIRLQEHQVDRGNPLRREDARDRVARSAAVRIWILFQRQSGGGPSALEPEDRAPYRRHRQQVVRRAHRDQAVQRLCGSGRFVVRGDGFEEVVLGNKRSDIDLS
ncbi:hypothetical protein XHV734_3369 [Xanthomonas hortorum pv. vitians]|nr:hypothetical protein XHV734_3369 [Xanthomonas hortorum pv. vitians]